MKSKVDPCMFCGCAPCECNKPVKPEPKKRAAKPAPESKPESTPVVEAEPATAKKMSFREAMKAQAALAPPPPPPATPKPEVKKPAQREIDVPTAMFEAAVRAFGPLLAPQEREKYRAILTSTASVAEQRAVWKERRREETV